MKVKGREIRHAGEGIQVEWFIQMAIDMFHNSVHPRDILEAALRWAIGDQLECRLAQIDTSKRSGSHLIPSWLGPAM